LRKNGVQSVAISDRRRVVIGPTVDAICKVSRSPSYMTQSTTVHLYFDNAPIRFSEIFNGVLVANFPGSVVAKEY